MKSLTISLLLIVAGGLSPAIGQTPAPLDKPTGGFGQALPPPVLVAPTEVKKAPRPTGAAVYAAAGGGAARTSSSDAIPPLVIQFSSTTPAVVQEWEEDLSVMTHIIEQALQRTGDEDGPTVKMGIPLLVTASRSVRPLYLEGFGALFMIKVNFPVLPPSTSDAEKSERTDSEWDKARQELYGRQEPWILGAAAESGADFDPAQVDELKKELLQALKNGTNIRHLKPEDYVSVTVFGTPNAGPKPTKASKRKAKSEPGAPSSAPLKVDPDTGLPIPRDVDRVIREQISPSRTSRPGTVLAMRVKKSDIDSFSSGKLSLEDFQKKVVMNSYLGSGYGITSLNSWIRAAFQELPFRSLKP